MPDDKTTQEPNAEGKDDGKTPPADFTAWLAGQPEDVQSLYEQHTAGLKSALKSERQRNADLAAELRDAAGKATGEAKANSTRWRHGLKRSRVAATSTKLRTPQAVPTCGWPISRPARSTPSTSAASRTSKP